MAVIVTIVVAISFLMLQKGGRISVSAIKFDDPQKINVCVVGGGPAGMIMVRHLANHSEFIIKAFEQNSDIGGQWLYSEDRNGASSVYKNLRTDYPGLILNIPDFMQIEASEGHCITHERYLNYFRAYAEAFAIRPFYQFNIKIENIAVDENGSFNLLGVNVHSGQLLFSKCDSVIMCDGGFTKPYIPKYIGIERFPGRVFHSHSYRHPEVFTKRIVLIVGAGKSGIGIALDLVEHASLVYISHRNERLTGPKPSNLLEKNEIVSINGRAITFKGDEAAVEIDDIIYCTGYTKDLSLLDKSVNLTIDDGFIYPLYQHMINVNHPKMAFIGVPPKPSMVSIFHIQAQYYASILKNISKLPLKSEMLQNAEVKTARKRDGHRIPNRYGYIDELAHMGKFEPHPYYYKQILKKWESEYFLNKLEICEKRHFTLPPKNDTN